MSRAYRVRTERYGECVLRMTKHGDSAQVRKEYELLGIMAKYVPECFAVPRPIACTDGAVLTTYVVGETLSPEMLSALPTEEGRRCMEDLGGLLRAVQSVPVEQSKDYVYAVHTLGTFFEKMEEGVEVCKEWIVPEAYIALGARLGLMRTNMGGYVSNPDAQVSMHFDVYTEHVLYDQTTGKMGLIDWGFTAVSHPLLDIRYLYEDYVEYLPELLRGLGRGS